MAKKFRLRFLLFFAAYLFLSTVAVAYDYHDASQSQICPICFMRSSLSSAVGEATFVPPPDDHLICLTIVEEAERFWNAARTSGASYRGPPLSSHISKTS